MAKIITTNTGPVTWPELWYRFVAAPCMSDDALLGFLKAYIDHAHHLMAFHTTGNWLTTEGSGLYHVGVLFPEFRESAAWRDRLLGLRRMRAKCRKPV